MINISINSGLTKMSRENIERNIKLAHVLCAKFNSEKNHQT